MPDYSLASLIKKFPIPNPKWSSLLDTTIQGNLSEQLFELNDFVPSADLVFRALQKNPEDIRVVILGQDPYPTKGHACGLAFGTSDGSVPASLKNIFKEIQKDCGGELRTNGDLSDWVEQGVLLLNVCLTTKPGQARAHLNMGWQVITTQIMNIICATSPYCVFLLWGTDAAKAYGTIKGGLVVNANGILNFANPGTADLLFCGHPSPMAYNTMKLGGFKGFRQFSQCNAYLTAHGFLPIKWN